MNQPAKLSQTGITGWPRGTASDLRTPTENSRCHGSIRCRNPPAKLHAAFLHSFQHPPDTIFFTVAAMIAVPTKGLLFKAPRHVIHVADCAAKYL
jgi:hypothetical protein